MNPLPTGAAPNMRFAIKAQLPPSPRQFSAVSAIEPQFGRKLAEGLQLTRASTIALTRLQLALASGDRRQAMTAIDRLHVLDGEIEQLVEQLPPSTASARDTDEHSLADHLPAAGDPPPGDDLLASLGKHIADQKLALAFEKLALASGISGPDLVSANHARAPWEDQAPSPVAQHAACDTPVVEWHAFPDVQTVVWDRLSPKMWGVFLATLLVLSLVAAAMMANVL